MTNQRNTIQFNLIEGLKAMVEWLKQSQLKLNPSKREVLWLAKDNVELGPQLPTLDGVPLTLA